MEILSAILIMALGGASLPGLVEGDAQWEHYIKTRQCDKSHYIKTVIFTKGDLSKPLEPKVYVPCNEWFKYSDIPG